MNDWPHAPPHRLMEAGAYMVTCGTYQKAQLLSTPQRLDFFLTLLFSSAKEFGWTLEAWAILSNHYHFIASSPENPTSLRKMISKLHTLSAREFNLQDQTPGRKVWFQFFDTHITYPSSYYARLKYVHYNPVHHGLIPQAVNYRWCSAGWFEQRANPAFYKTIQQFKTDRVNVLDGFDPQPIEASENGVKPPYSK